MTVMSTPGTSRAPRPSSLAEVLEVILDKGIVIDAYVRVAVVGIELITIDARIVIASVETYLRFAEAVNRLDLQPRGQVAGVPGVVEELGEGAARAKTKGALSGAKDKAQEFVSDLTGGGDEEEEEEEEKEEEKPRQRRGGAKKTAQKRTRKSSS